MLMKRQFNHDSDGVPTSVSHIEMQRSTERWHASPRVVEKGIAEGWLSVGGGKLTIKTAVDDQDVVYKIDRGPGHYCCECHAPLDGEHSARRHVLEEHASVPAKLIPKDNQELQDGFHALLADQEFESSDGANPSGYCKLNYYDCARQ